MSKLAQVVIILIVGLLAGCYIITTNYVPQDDGNLSDDKNLIMSHFVGQFERTRNIVVQNTPESTSGVGVGVPEIRKDYQEWIPVIPRADHLDILRPGLVNNVVHYLWCERKIFEFQHYLSVLSVMRIINPERLVFHYSHYPRHDLQFYHTWFEDMKKEFPYIELVDIGINSSSCSSQSHQRDYMTQLLHEQGGIYVHFNTIFLNFPSKYREIRITDGLSNGMEGFLIMHAGVRYDGHTTTSICQSAETFDKNDVDVQNFLQEKSTLFCAIKKGPYFPRDAWNKTDIFSQSVNILLYNSPRRPEAQPSTDNLIPNIGHVVWVGGAQMPFLFYLNCLSQLYIVEVDVLYVHCDVEPTGKYWQLIKQEKKVSVVHILKPDLVFRNKIKVLNHMVDVYRVNILSRYGGIYSDSDVVWIKPIPRELRTYDAVASYDWPQMYNIYPDYIQIGVLLGKPGARIWNYLMHSFKEFKDEMYGYNGLLKTYKVFERHPDLLHVYDKLQVMCWDLRCHPTWYPDFRDKDTDHRQHPDFNWREAHTFHWTVPTPQELLDESSLQQSNSIFAEIGRHILKAAGKI